jgi:hypothetical protein
MAGYPPVRRGYFVNQLPDLKNCFNMLLDAQMDPQPMRSIVFLVAPAIIFLLTGMSNQPNDQHLLDELLEAVRIGARSLHYGALNQASVDAIVLPWLSGHEGKLSPYWRRRFSRPTDASKEFSVGELPRPVVSECLSDMPMRLLCMVVGSVDRYFGNNLN